eukprot:s4629_g3.t1
MHLGNWSKLHQKPAGYGSAAWPGTPEAAPRKISMQRKVSEPGGQSLRPDSPKRKAPAPAPMAVVRRDSAPGGGLDVWEVNASEVPNSTATNISNISNVSNVSKVRKFRPMECCGLGCMCRDPKTWMCKFCDGADYFTCCTNDDDDWMKPIEFPKPPVIPEIPTFPPVELPKPPCHYPPC